MTLTFDYPIFGLKTTTTCPGCCLGTKLHLHKFVVVPSLCVSLFQMSFRLSVYKNPAVYLSGATICFCTIRDFRSPTIIHVGQSNDPPREKREYASSEDSEDSDKYES